MTLEIRKLSKRIDDSWILRDVSFEVEKGEIFGVLGFDAENITSLLRIIYGLDSPDGGSITFEGVEVENGRKAGFLYFGEETTSRWRGIFSSPRKLSRARSHERLLAESLSNPKTAFLVENPVQTLDPLETVKFTRQIREVTSKEDLCTLVATNDPAEVMQLCDRVGVLSAGEIVQIGKPEEVYLNPASIASASLFGACNFIDAKRLNSNKEDNPEFFTLTGEHRLVTGAVEKRELGPINQAITLAVRPEHISLSFGASFPEDNLLKAKVVAVKFLGPITSVSLDAGGLELKAFVLRVVGLNEGDDCMVGLPPDRIRILTK